MDSRDETVRQQDGSSDRRWVVVTDDGAVSTLGRATDPTDEELARLEETLATQGIGVWLAVQSHSFHGGPPPPTFIPVRRMGVQGLSFEDAVIMARTRAAGLLVDTGLSGQGSKEDLDACEQPFIGNIGDRKPFDMHGDKKFVEETEAVRDPARVILTFDAAATTFEAIMLRVTSLAAPAPDDNDRDALGAGYTVLHTIVARDIRTLKPFLIFEMYSTDCKPPYLEKGVQVDLNYQRKGIATAFFNAFEPKYPFRLSGKQTVAGARLMNSLRKKNSPLDVDH